ncbi:MAG TPA: sugar phosphate nucleotidyltransferase [Candidatus Saccharimonadales bacterium]
MTCKHAIIIAAGYGTRRLPITKAVEKCMLPILDRPLVDYIVEDCIKAGIEHIVFVVNEDSTQIKDFYSQYEALEKYLHKHGKQKYIELIEPPKVKFEFVEQTNELLFNHYGTNTAVALARPTIPHGEPALVIMGDALLYGKDGHSPLTDFLQQIPEGESAALTKEVLRAEVSKYGVLVVGDNGYLDHMVEKPKPEEAPSTLINLAEYLFTSDLLDETVRFFDDPIVPGKEKYVNIEPFNRYLAKKGKIKVVPVTGEYLDVGTLQGWLKANDYVARATNIL